MVELALYVELPAGDLTALKPSSRFSKVQSFQISCASFQPLWCRRTCQSGNMVLLRLASTSPNGLSLTTSLALWPQTFHLSWIPSTQVRLLKAAEAFVKDQPGWLLQMHHPEGSPLALCDTCPRSFHLLCMGLDWEELSEGDWSCPRCAERKGLPTKRLTVDEVKNRQSTGGGRCVPLMSVC